MTDDRVETSEPSFPGGRMTKRNHLALSAYWLSTNLLWGAMLVILVPSQMKQLAPANPAEMVGLLLGVGAVPALVVPLLVGPLSDRCMSRWGRRRPYMVVGSAVNVAGLALLWYASLRLNLWLYFAGYLVTNVGNNIATGSYSGMIPDIVPKDQRGEASGWMATMSQIGTILGVVSASRLMAAGHMTASYAVIAASMVLFLLVTVLGTKERPRREAPDPIDWAKFIKNLWIDPRKHPDFAWVWITRALVVMGMWTVQEYMQFYLTDVMKVAEADKEMVTGQVVLAMLVCATITGVLGGIISDRLGRRKIVVYVANTTIAAASVALLVSPSLTWVYVIGAVFGLGLGAYYSVDWAMGCDVLPNKDDAAKDMAVWHVAMVLPQSIALPLAGWLLGLFGKTMTHTPAGMITHYTHSGYTAIFCLAAFFLALGAVLLRNVRGVA